MFLKEICFYTTGASPALTHARNCLQSWGYTVRQSMGPDVTHVFLPVPSFSVDWDTLLPQLGTDVTVLGGALPPLPAKAVDFLQDPYYTAENAAITAHCALKLLLNQLGRTLDGAKILLLGWGRIGKCLAPLLRGLGAEVSVAARKESDRAMLEALGYTAVPLPVPEADIYDILINTVPAPVMEEADAAPGALLLDLASVKGIAGPSVLWERGLPGRLAPQSAGALIAKTALRYALGKE